MFKIASQKNFDHNSIILFYKILFWEGGTGRKITSFSGNLKIILCSITIEESIKTEKSPSANIFIFKICLKRRETLPFVSMDRYESNEAYKHTHNRYL